MKYQLLVYSLKVERPVGGGGGGIGGQISMLNGDFFTSTEVFSINFQYCT